MLGSDLLDNFDGRVVGGAEATNVVNQNYVVSSAAGDPANFLGRRMFLAAAGPLAGVVSI